jgi:uncharacterized protein with GYD domain
VDYVVSKNGLFRDGEDVCHSNRFNDVDNRRCHVPKYLFTGTLTDSGLKGILKEGGTSRWKAVGQLAKSLGGTLESYYYAFGDPDLYVVMDLPDNVSAAAGSLIANAAGTTHIQVTVLIPLEEVDQATDLAKKVTGEYRPPGQ